MTAPAPEDFAAELRKCSAAEGAFFDRCADEIERLERELAEAKADYLRIHRMYVDAKYPETVVTDAKALEAERDRLRAALEQIRRVDISYSVEGLPMPAVAFGECLGLADRALSPNPAPAAAEHPCAAPSPEGAGEATVGAASATGIAK